MRLGERFASEMNIAGEHNMVESKRVHVFNFRSSFFMDECWLFTGLSTPLAASHEHGPSTTGFFVPYILTGLSTPSALDDGRVVCDSEKVDGFSGEFYFVAVKLSLNGIEYGVPQFVRYYEEPRLFRNLEPITGGLYVIAIAVNTVIVNIIGASSAAKET